METSELRKYPPVVTFEENDGIFYYRACFREFPDMVGGIGDTVEQAISAAYAMLDAEIAYREEESLPIPKPQISELSIPVSGRMTLRMSKTLHKRVIEASEKEGVSLNSYINEAVAFYIGSHASPPSYIENK